MTDATIYDCKSVSGLGNYQYLVYAILVVTTLGSEALGLTKYVKPNTITEVIIALFKKVLPVKKEDKPPELPHSQNTVVPINIETSK